MYIKDYIQATYEVIRKSNDAESTLRRLQEHLAKRGLQKKYPSIVRGLYGRMLREQSGREPVVTIAREKDLKVLSELIETLRTKLSQGKTYTVQVDANIIGGFIIENKSKRIDRSYKQELLQAYQRLIATDTI